MTNARTAREELERTVLKGAAVRAADSKGRAVPEPECEVRTCFQRISTASSTARLSGGSCTRRRFSCRPEGDHYRTRLTHTLEVSRIARTIARALSLNEDLTEAVALGHDLGHTPFGHAGERALDEILSLDGGFRHNEQSLRVVDRLEKTAGA